MLDSLLESAQPEANKALQEIYNAEDRNHALLAVAAFEKTYGAKFPKAVKKITDDIDELLAFSWSDRSCSPMFRVPAGSLIAECQGELMAEALVLLGKSPVARDHQGFHQAASRPHACLDVFACVSRRPHDAEAAPVSSVPP